MAASARTPWRPSAHASAAVYGNNVPGDWKRDVPGREQDTDAQAKFWRAGDALRSTTASRQASEGVEEFWRGGGAAAEPVDGGSGHDQKAALYRSSVVLGGGNYLNMTAEQSERRDKAAAMAALPLKPRHAAASGAAAEGGRPVATPVGERWNLQPMVLGDEVLFVDARTKRVYAALGVPTGAAGAAAARHAVQQGLACLILTGVADTGAPLPCMSADGCDPFSRVLALMESSKRSAPTLALRCGAARGQVADKETLRRMVLAALPDASEACVVYFCAMMLAMDAEDEAVALAPFIGLFSLEEHLRTCARIHADIAAAVDGRQAKPSLMLAMRRLRRAASAQAGERSAAWGAVGSSEGADAAGVARLARLVCPTLAREELRLCVACLAAGSAMRLSEPVPIAEVAAAMGLVRVAFD